METNQDECMEWLLEARKVFPKLDKKTILTEYKKMSSGKLGFVRAKIVQELDFNPESLLLGKSTNIKKRIIKPQEFVIYINEKLKEIQNPALRKEVIQYIIIHELSHIASEDIITLSKQYRRRKKKRIHTKNFEEEIFNRYNILREKKGIIKIKEIEHLERAINRILINKMV